MIRRILGGIFYKKSHAIYMADRAYVRLRGIRSKLRKDMQALKKVQKKTEALLERVSEITEVTTEDIDDCYVRIEQSIAALQAVRAEHEVDAEVVIPRLQSAVEAVKADNDRKIAEANYHKGVASGGRRERDL